MEHLLNLDQIAKQNGGNRAAISTGFNASTDYVLEKLNKYKNYFNITTQHFNYEQFTELETPIFLLDGVSLIYEKNFQR